MRLRDITGTFAAALLACAPLAAPVGAQEVGVLAAVNRDVVGERPAEPPRQLVLNERLITDERITTTALGGGQVLFLDQTSLTLSPNSDIVLDRYLYDPERDSGDLSVSVLKGAMRLVGGRITKQGEALIRTPSATIGIRGGIGHVAVNDDGSGRYIHVAGESSTITTAEGETVTVTREGGVVDIAAPLSDGGDRLVYQGVATPDILDGALGAPVGRGDGGARTAVTRPIVRDGIEPIVIAVSAAPETLSEPPVTTTGEPTAEIFRDEPIIAAPPEDEIADRNIAEDIADEVVQPLDGVSFDGTWSAFAGLSDDGFVLTQSGLRFQMDFSLATAEGIVAVELPDTGDFDGPNTTDLRGAPLLGDRFLVVGEEDGVIVGDDGIVTELGGDASGAELTLSGDDVLTGSVFIDYEGSALANTDFVDGDLDPIAGARVEGAGIRDSVQAFRDIR